MLDRDHRNRHRRFIMKLGWLFPLPQPKLLQAKRSVGTIAAARVAEPVAQAVAQNRVHRRAPGWHLLALQ